MQELYTAFIHAMKGHSGNNTMSQLNNTTRVTIIKENNNVDQKCNNTTNTSNDNSNKNNNNNNNRSSSNIDSTSKMSVNVKNDMGKADNLSRI